MLNIRISKQVPGEEERYEKLWNRIRTVGPNGYSIQLQRQGMKVWFNKINESRRNVVEVSGSQITIGRDASNTVCLQSPLVSRQHAVVRVGPVSVTASWSWRTSGLNSCVVGEEEVLGGQTGVSSRAPRCGSGPTR